MLGGDNEGRWYVVGLRSYCSQLLDLGWSRTLRQTLADFMIWGFECGLVAACCEASADGIWNNILYCHLPWVQSSSLQR